MNARGFPLLVGSISLSLLSGCTAPAIVGDWTLTGWWIDGEIVEMNYSYRSDDGYRSSSVYATGELEIDDDHAGSFAFDEVWGNYGEYGGETGYRELRGEVEWEMLQDKIYEVKIDVEGWDRIRLECLVDGDDLACEGEDKGGTTRRWRGTGRLIPDHGAWILRRKRILLPWHGRHVIAQKRFMEPWMNTRVFPLLVGSIGLSLLSSCTPAIVGDWNLSKWSIDGERADLDYSYGGYNVTSTMVMEIDDDMEGSFDFEMEIEGYGAYAGYSDSYSASGDVEWEVLKGNTYDVKIDIEDGDILKLECTVDGDEMECDGDAGDGNDYEMEWERD